MIFRLRLRSVSPPGGFSVTAPTGYRLTGGTFSEITTALKKHMEANGYDSSQAEEMVDEHTARKLYENHHYGWIVKIVNHLNYEASLS